MKNLTEKDIGRPPISRHLRWGAVYPATVLFILIGVAEVVAQPSDWIAITADGKGTWGYARRSSETAAITKAMGICGPACKVEVTGQNRCFAYVESRQGGYWYGVSIGRAQDGVQRSAMTACSGGAPRNTCRLVKVDCR
jgi:Domain of unknown function (DUF4189)